MFQNMPTVGNWSVREFYPARLLDFTKFLNLFAEEFTDWLMSTNDINRYHERNLMSYFDKIYAWLYPIKKQMGEASYEASAIDCVFEHVKELEARRAKDHEDWEGLYAENENNKKLLEGATQEFQLHSRRAHELEAQLAEALNLKTIALNDLEQRMKDTKRAIEAEAKLAEAESCIKGSLRRFDQGCHVLYLGDTYLKMKGYEAKYLKVN